MKGRSSYPFDVIEPKWQKYWESINLYEAPEKPRKKFYLLEMFPYPSGGDLHMGHLKNYAIGDTVARIYLMEGYDVLHPMGWDAFGLPAENAAIKYGIHPKQWTERNIEAYRHHLKLLGISYDWNREIATCWPDYYRWTQWLFLYLYRKGLAYRATDYVNFCPSCQTVLANEQVIQGQCERCHSMVTKRALEQWYFRITAYAERLLDDLKMLEGSWPDFVIKQQINWIGRSEGTEIVFRLKGDESLQFPVFTTRADTLFGVTFVTIAPEHRLLDRILPLIPDDRRPTVEAYREEAIHKSEIDRTATDKPKSGVFTGLYLIHPYHDNPIPLWVGDYVLASYGTGIVMGVPAHDQRDFEFARKHGLPIVPVIRPVDGDLPEEQHMNEAWTDYGIMENSGPFSGLSSEEGIRAIQNDLKSRGLGGPAVTYRLRDWLVSRQRYWGAPIPMIHCQHCGIVPVPENELPVLLPENVENFKPTGRSPLEDIPEFMNTTCPRCQQPARRDPDTMDTFVDSSWYYLRYIDPKNSEAPFDKDKVHQWMPVDQYIGGAEHATKHLIYARFINKVLYDDGLVPHPEPFRALFSQGLVLKRYLWCSTCLRVVDESETYSIEDTTYHEPCGQVVESRLEMMSKSKGNVVPVGPFVKTYGADVGRIAIMFAGPAEKDFEWTDAIVEGARNFVQRVWRLFNEKKIHYQESLDTSSLQGHPRKLYIRVQQTIRDIRDDFKRFRFNTAIAALMSLLNELSDFEDRDHPVYAYALTVFTHLLAPIAPHLAEELWHQIGGTHTIFRRQLPDADPAFLEEDEIEIPVQVNGKVRGTIRVSRHADASEVEQRAKEHENVRRHLDQKEIIKVIYIPQKLLNFVVKG